MNILVLWKTDLFPFLTNQVHELDHTINKTDCIKKTFTYIIKNLSSQIFIDCLGNHLSYQSLKETPHVAHQFSPVFWEVEAGMSQLCGQSCMYRDPVQKGKAERQI